MEIETLNVYPFYILCSELSANENFLFLLNIHIFLPKTFYDVRGRCVTIVDLFIWAETFLWVGQILQCRGRGQRAGWPAGPTGEAGASGGWGRRGRRGRRGRGRGRGWSWPSTPPARTGSGSAPKGSWWPRRDSSNLYLISRHRGIFPIVTKKRLYSILPKAEVN